MFLFFFFKLIGEVMRMLNGLVSQYVYIVISVERVSYLWVMFQCFGFWEEDLELYVFSKFSNVEMSIYYFYFYGGVYYGQFQFFLFIQKFWCFMFLFFRDLLEILLFLNLFQIG